MFFTIKIVYIFYAQQYQTNITLQAKEDKAYPDCNVKREK